MKLSENANAKCYERSFPSRGRFCRNAAEQAAASRSAAATRRASGCNRRFSAATDADAVEDDEVEADVDAENAEVEVEEVASVAGVACVDGCGLAVAVVPLSGWVVGVVAE